MMESPGSLTGVDLHTFQKILGTYYSEMRTTTDNWLHIKNHKSKECEKPRDQNKKHLIYTTLI
jgi:hypothetical protein